MRSRRSRAPATPRPPAKAHNRHHQTAGELQNVLARRGADGDQDYRHLRQLRLHGAVEGGEGGHHVSHQKHHQPDHQHQQNAGINQRDDDLLTNRQSQLLVGDVTIQYFRQAAAFFAGHDRRDVDLGEDPLLRGRLRRAACRLYFVPNAADVRPQLDVGQAVGQQIQPFQNRQAGPDQGDELLIEDQEALHVELLRPETTGGGRNARSCLYGINQKTLLRVPVAELFFGTAGHHLLMDLAADIGILEHKIGHGLLSTFGQLRAWRKLELEQAVAEERVHFFLGKGVVQNRAIERRHFHLLNPALGSYQEFHRGVGEIIALGLGCDARGGAGAFRAPLNVLELLLKVQLTEQEGERRAQVFGILHLKTLGLILFRVVKVEELPVGDGELACGFPVIPPHAPGLAQCQRPALHLLAHAGPQILFIKKDLKSSSAVVADFDPVEQGIQVGIGAERRHRY